MLLLNMVQTAASRRTADPSRPLSDFSPTFKKSRLGMFSGLLTQTLRKRLTDFQSALDRFAWPSTKSTSLTARLADMDEDLNNKVTARLHYDDDARPANRFFSRGLDGSATTSLETGTYKTVLTLGGRSDTVTFDIEYGDTNRDVFDAFAEQVNKSSLDVQAEVFTQTGAEAKVGGRVLHRNHPGAVRKPSRHRRRPGTFRHPGQLSASGGILLHRLPCSRSHTHRLQPHRIQRVPAVEL